jgi:hypothetical protein
VEFVAGSRRLPTAAARVRAQVRSCGIRGGQSDSFPQSTQVPSGALRYKPEGREFQTRRGE